jgi:membrane protein DedA with SNARE-associated domain
VTNFLHDEFMPLIREHGVVVVGVVTMLESIGVPAPGESAVIAAAIYAATTHQISIVPLVIATALGAIMGDNIGYFLGRWIGVRAIARYGYRVGLTEARVRIGRYLFKRYGAGVVIFGRFFALLRTFTAILAGANHMPWNKFLPANAIGGSLWASFYGFGAFALGREASAVERPIALTGIGIAVVVVATSIVFLRRHEALLEKAAEREFPKG